MTRRIYFLGLVTLLATGLALAIGNPFEHRGTKSVRLTLTGPDTKAGAETLVLRRAAAMVSPGIRAKFVDQLTGLLLDNDYAQCYPSTTTNGWWVCELNSTEHPRPQVWFSVSYSGVIRVKGEQPLGYGWVPATTLATSSRRHDAPKLPATP